MKNIGKIECIFISLLSMLNVLNVILKIALFYKKLTYNNFTQYVHYYLKRCKTKLKQSFFKCTIIKCVSLPHCLLYKHPCKRSYYRSINSEQCNRSDLHVELENLNLPFENSYVTSKCSDFRQDNSVVPFGNFLLVIRFNSWGSCKIEFIRVKINLRQYN